ncbi:Mo25-PA [Gonapodya prolifera JEL478]|uniref:Mo25-PA n=1 Tax=Gonapodya prolifera (strain JEL478) TaxID=1344416 RepID=A0A139B0F1_GONPJ|nr:Mo25-PA [Gonapodya prolifera JEL478]|eukprot:KXS22447.1 Mo25-PA [Gonapodya prolifera JEL478]
MAFLFKPKTRSPQDLVRYAKELALKLGDSDTKKINEEFSRTLAEIKRLLYGDTETEPQPDQVAQIAQEVYSTDLLQVIVQNIARFEFEARKDVASIFNNLLRRQIGTRSPTVEYLQTKEAILISLLTGYENQEIALNCGMILRECIRHEVLAKALLLSPNFWKFTQYVELSTFDTASDAFATFKDLLTKHKQLVADFLDKNYDQFFEKYTQLLMSSNYVTKRQSLKLLGELLLDRANFTVMTRYIGNAENLKLMMNLLRDKSRNIQFEAFHVFKVGVSLERVFSLPTVSRHVNNTLHPKVFVANPNKSKPVLDILQKNKDKLLSFLSNFQTDRTDDEQFNDEKAFLIKQIREL